MPKTNFNEAEQYLLRNWQQARLVAESMEAVRGKYSELFDRIWEAVRGKHEELDDKYIRPTQRWASGFIGVGRKAWRAKGSSLAGLYIENVRLEVLADEEADAPYAGVWVGSAKKPATDTAGVERIVSATGTLLTPDELGRCTLEPSGFGYVIWYPLPEKRQELLDMAIEGDGQRFVDCLVSHFDVFARLIPVMDEAFAAGQKAGS